MNSTIRGCEVNRIVALSCVDGSERAVEALNVDEVIALERRIADEGTSLLELMKRAGGALAECVLEWVSAASSVDKIVVLAGSGNNGGDGWVAARILADAGRDVTVVTKAMPDALRTEPARTAALEAIGDARALGVAEAPTMSVSVDMADVSYCGFRVVVDPDEGELEGLLRSADLVIDAILGTGFANEQVRDPYAKWIDLTNSARQDGGVVVISADCPSGLNAQTGESAAQCVVADVTVTMIAPKRGLLEPNTARFVGELLLAPLV